MKLQKLTTSITVTRSLPENVKEEEKNFFLNERQRFLPACFLNKHTNVCLLQDGTIFKYFSPYKESFVSLEPNHRLHNFKGLLRLFLTRPKVQLPRGISYLLVHDAWSKGYYHWLTDFLPRLFLAKDLLNKAVLLIPESFKGKFHSECLALFDIKQIVYLKENIIYQVSELYFVSHIAHMGNYHPEVMLDFTKFLKKHIDEKATITFPDKIYVTRENAERRKITNEEEVIKLMRSYDFAILNLEDFSFLEQVSICSNSRYLVSIHGAGLTNMIFMQPGGAVFELRKRDNNVNYFFYTLAASSGLKYYYQFCDALYSELAVQDADIYVEIGSLKSNIDLMLHGNIEHAN